MKTPVHVHKMSHSMQALILLLAIAVAAGAPVYQISAETEVIWEIPAKPKGVIFAAHGCNHGAIDWWPQSSDCPRCIGLPEEVNITQRALSRGYAVVAVSSHDRSHSRCWRAAHLQAPRRPTKDVQQVMRSVKAVMSEHQLDGLPVYALGASSGGAFVLALPFYMELAGVCAQISGFPIRMFEHLMEAAKKVDPKFHYPPTAFVHMPRDEYTASDIFSLKQMLHEVGSKTKEVEVLPRPITKEYLLHKLPSITESQATKIVGILRAVSVLDGTDMPVGDPREAPWRPEMRKDPELATIPAAADVTPLPEVLNLAFAVHEIVSDTTDEVIDWWESNERDSM